MTGTVKPGLSVHRERILVAGDANVGKGFAVLSIANDAFNDEANHSDGKYRDQAPKFYILDTDDGMSPMLEPGAEFEHLYFDNGGNVYPFVVRNWMDAAMAWHTIMEAGKKGDWIVVDPINRLYEFTQSAIADLKNIDIAQETVSRQLRNQGFGAFDGNTWNAVTRLFTTIFGDGAFEMKPHFLATCHIRDNVDNRMKRDRLVMFDEVGFEPTVPPKVPGAMDTIVFLWAHRQIPRNPNGRRIDGVSAKTVRYLEAVKNRGLWIHERRVMDRDFYPLLLDMRKSAAKVSENVTDETEAAAIEAEIREEGTMPENPVTLT